MTAENPSFRNLLVIAHQLMGPDPIRSGPKSIGRLLEFAADAQESLAKEDDCRDVRSAMLSDDPNSPTRGHFAHMLRTWDFAPQASWTGTTSPNTDARRQMIYAALGLTPA